MTGRGALWTLVSVLAGLGILFVGAGFAGRFFAAGDAAAILRPQAGALLILLAALLWWGARRRTALVACLAGGFGLATALGSLFATQTACAQDCLTLYQKNLLSKAWPRYPLADDIIASGAEVVTLQEVSDHNREYMSALFDHYPTAITCAFRPAQDVAVLTSMPVVAGSAFCLEGMGMAGVQLRRPDGQTLWAVSLHLHWPFPFEQHAQSRRLAKHLAGLEGPVLIAGDFNMVPWGGSVQRIAAAADAMRLAGARNTYRAGGALLPLTIDMVLVPDGATGQVEVRPLMGSDHYGILARIGLGGP